MSSVWSGSMQSGGISTGPESLDRNTSMKPTGRTIYTKMVADLFHHGHVNFLERARSLGERLVVHVVDDERVTAYKRRPVMDQTERARIVAACRHVDEVVLSGPREITSVFLRERGYALYAYGFANDRERGIKRSDCRSLSEDQIAEIPYTPGVSTTEIIDRIVNRSKEG